MGKQRVGTYKGKPIIEVDEDERFLQNKNELLYNRNGTLLTNEKKTMKDTISSKIEAIFLKYLNANNNSIIDKNDGAFIEKYAIKCWPNVQILQNDQYNVHEDADKIGHCFAAYYEPDKTKFWIVRWGIALWLQSIKITKLSDGTYKKVNRNNDKNIFYNYDKTDA